MQMAWSSRHICLFAKKINLLDLPHAAQSSFKFHVVSVEKVKMAMKQSVYACTRVPFPRCHGTNHWLFGEGVGHFAIKKIWQTAFERKQALLLVLLSYINAEKLLGR